MHMNIPFLTKKDEKVNVYYKEGHTPDHIAIIMDGNGRWAQKRGLPRFAGHKEGLSAVVKVVKAAAKCKVKVLTLYTFSTENWKRPKPEVEFILKLPKEFLHVYLPEIKANNVRIEVIGNMEELPVSTQEALQYAIDSTKENDGLQLNLALNYGSKHEMIHAMKDMFADLIDEKISLDEVDEQQFSTYLDTAGMPNPDLLIRTGGEKRLSNFLLWQMAYTEFCFSDVLWPDFTEKEFMGAMEEYQLRKRRFGGIG
ncbi:isoprenyl transferase [Aquibacillus koreensis]|uniref:Isoprenyl transferase n=1 Tax=Aquibacillus koreensis TaxID=279446 RepID=A0A9X3WPI6_9BACI|nr:isoprenyl transferase [Aquibacillus koreensis]MCT2535338.1 isoprenyl transferase [Aquibacillus koreensis]MDC3422503.1 isoprenyl transferase [Aquibacillus koreensis]